MFDLKKIEEKKQKLEHAKIKLKEHFIGIDSIIDQIIDNMKSWYLLPEVVTRPIIINLWGLTGIGKTDLVRKLVKYIEFDEKFAEIQMGEKKNSYYSTPNIYSTLSRNYIESGDSAILLIDEIQRFRTRHRQKDEDVITKEYGDIWTLLSDGKLNIKSGQKQAMLEMFLGELYYKECQNEEDEDEDKNEIVNDDTKPVANKQPKRKFHNSVYSAKELKTTCKLSEPIEEIMKWDVNKKFKVIEDTLNSDDLNEPDDFSKVLIFICGNIDDAYSSVMDDSNADRDADLLHELSKKINIVHIKDALEERFFPEQIARFGNNHIIMKH